MVKFFGVRGLLCDAQHEYKRGRSALTVTVKLIDLVADAWNEGTFDCVDHEILLEKLFYYAVSGKLRNLLKSYLQKREQRVCYSRELSAMKYVNRAVPERSILGPILFIISYIKDLPVKYPLV